MATPHARTRAFTPHHLHAMVRAFDVVCAQLHVSTRGGGRKTHRVASRIFDLAMARETDQARLVAKTLAEFNLDEGRQLMPSLSQGRA